MEAVAWLRSIALAFPCYWTYHSRLEDTLAANALKLEFGAFPKKKQKQAVNSLELK